MSETPALLLLHGIGDGDRDGVWPEILAESLQRVAGRDLTDVRVIAPLYSHALKGADKAKPLPETTVDFLSADDAVAHRRNFERRRTAMEQLLGPDEPGDGVRGTGAVASWVTDINKQTDNYANDPAVRAQVLRLILDELPTSGRLVIVGHSLGSVITADLVRRLPPEVQVEGVVTIGSPLAHPTALRSLVTDALAEPPANLAWWVNFWNSNDGAASGRGVSHALPWVLDQRLPAPGSAKVKLIQAHYATSYLRHDRVAKAIARGLFEPRLTPPPRPENPPDQAETMALLALRLAHLTLHRLEGDRRVRFSKALREVQADAVKRLTDHSGRDGRVVPAAVAHLLADVPDPKLGPHSPVTPNHLSIEEAIVPLTAVVAGNNLHPFEIDVPDAHQQWAVGQLTLEMGLGTRVGANVLRSIDEAAKVLRDPINWLKWGAIGVGAAALVAATGGLALSGAPGVAGAASVTSALAAFGPGGMIGGLLTAGALTSAGGASLAVGLSAGEATSAAVEAVVGSQLMAAILRDLQGFPRDETVLEGLESAETDLRSQLERTSVVSDPAAPGVKELRRKLEVIGRAITYLAPPEDNPAAQPDEDSDAEA